MTKLTANGRQATRINFKRSWEESGVCSRAGVLASVWLRDRISAKRDGYIIEDPVEFVESVRKTGEDPRRPFTIPEIFSI